MGRLFFIVSVLLLPLNLCAQYWVGNDNVGRLDLLGNVGYSVEMQASFSKDATPLWLNANKHGLSSLEECNGYIRAAVERPLSTDSMRRWGVGYGVDFAVPFNYTSDVVVQQAWIEGRWLHGVLTVGSREWPMELKNNRLSSGSQTLGINARPIPQVRIALPNYWVPPFANGWLRFKGHIAYGVMTDERWQHDFTSKLSKYADGLLYHSKAGYLKIGNEDRFLPWSLELGLEMAATFGGTAYRFNDDGTIETLKGNSGLSGFWHALIPGGSDAGETTYTNTAGNHVGSWLIRVNYDNDDWGMRVYFDKFFEDHSAMFQLDYDGYGSGDEWDEKKKSRYLLYDFKDMMLGFELNLRRSTWLRDIVFEYIYTKYQSGPVFHDHTEGLSDHVAGNDNYYNNYIYPGWQHWGQVIGNPLYRSPIYNTDGTIMVQDSRFMAFHLAFDGKPTDDLNYRAMFTWQEGLGTYEQPYTEEHHNFSFMVEVDYALPHNWKIKGAYGMDFGYILGSNAGTQLTISKSGLFK